MLRAGGIICTESVRATRHLVQRFNLVTYSKLRGEIPNVLIRAIFGKEVGVKEGFSEEFRWQIGWATQNMPWWLRAPTPTRRFALPGINLG